MSSPRSIASLSRDDEDIKALMSISHAIMSPPTQPGTGHSFFEVPSLPLDVPTPPEDGPKTEASSPAPLSEDGHGLPSNYTPAVEGLSPAGMLHSDSTQADQVATPNGIMDQLADASAPDSLLKEEPNSAQGLELDEDEDSGSYTDEMDIELNYREFRCVFDPQTDCMTGQYTMNLARKVISDYFGRNKAETLLINFWPCFCRKHYQRATYNLKPFQRRKIALILSQVAEIEKRHPGTHYKVSLRSCEMDRYSTYASDLTRGVSVEEATAQAAPVEGAKTYQAPIEALCKLQTEGHCGKDKTKDEVIRTVNRISEMFENGETNQIVSIEFLPQLRAPTTPGGEIVRFTHAQDAIDAAARKEADKKAKKAQKDAEKTAKKAAKKPASRVSNKGGIVKTSAKKTPAKSKLRAMDKA